MSTTADDDWVRGPLGRPFADLTAALLDAQTVHEVLERVVGATQTMVPEADIVSVTLRTPDGRFHTPVHTDPLAIELDRAQYELREGPCVSAADPNGPAAAESADLGTDSQWPGFAAAATGLGVASVLALTLVPSPAPPRQSGALNVYSRTPHGLDGVDKDVVLLLATHASLAIAGTTAATTAELQADNLRKAIDSRDVLGQAKGILMARRGIDADAAFEILRRTSQQLNVKLVALAQTLSTRHTDL